MTPKQRRASLIRRSHRSLGAAAAMFVVFMIVTGIIINHSHSLGLDQRHLFTRYLLDWYGLQGPARINSFQLEGRWLNTAGAQVFLDDKPVAEMHGVVGAVTSQDLIVVAAGKEWLLLDGSGQLIERQPWDPAQATPVDSIGRLPGGEVVVKSGETHWQSDSDLLTWQPLENLPSTPHWSSIEETPGPLSSSIKEQYRGEGLSFERVLLDLHSGRFFGPVGVLVYDLLALFIGFLAISGLIMWSRSKRNGKR